MKQKRIKFISDLITKDQFSTKVYLYFATPSYGEDYDPYEKNITYSNLNPLSLKAYVREISPESLVWRQMGLQEMGAKEILCDEKYKEWFLKSNKIVIDGDNYSVMKEGTGGNALIQKRPYNIIRIVLSKAT